MTEAIARRDVWFDAQDGTRLYAADFGPLDAGNTPLLCLSGLTRNHRDFEPVVQAFGANRRIVAPDYRGRGQSQAAADPMSYQVNVELQDVLQLLDLLQIEEAAVIGTSRGGIIGMIMASVARERLSGLMLVDIGPVIEPAGLRRIAEFVGVERIFGSWDEAAVFLSQSSAGFANVSLAQWLTVARRIYRDNGNQPATSHDVRLAGTFPKLEDIDASLPDLWQMVPALANLPAGLIYGIGSDLLSSDTVAKMQTALPELSVTPVPDRGHVPFLDEPQSREAITSWLAAVDRAGKS